MVEKKNGSIDPDLVPSGLQERIVHREGAINRHSNSVIESTVAGLESTNGCYGSIGIKKSDSRLLIHPVPSWPPETLNPRPAFLLNCRFRGSLHASYSYASCFFRRAHQRR